MGDKRQLPDSIAESVLAVLYRLSEHVCSQADALPPRLAASRHADLAVYMFSRIKRELQQPPAGAADTRSARQLARQVLLKVKTTTVCVFHV